MFLAICDLHTGNVRYTNAGHNPPFVKRANGEVESLTDIHGPVAGAVEGLAYKQSDLQLNQGDLLFLYTDGVSEAMNAQDELFSDSEIANRLSQLPGNDPEQSIDTLLSAVDEHAAGCEQSDDITMLAFRFDADTEGMAKHHLELILTNQLSEIDRMNDSFNKFAEEAEVPMAVSLKLNMVFDELLNNIISYAYEDQDSHEIRVQVDLINNRLVIAIEDDGVPFNPFMREDPDTEADLEDRSMGGLGTYLVKKVMDEVSYKRNLNRNRVTLIKQIES